MTRAAIVAGDTVRHFSNPASRAVVVAIFPADRDEGWNYEEGTIIGLNKKGQIVTVELDPKYRDGVDDDGLRETGTEFCRPITEKREN